MSKSKRNRTKKLAMRVAEAFDRDALALVCELGEEDFGDYYDLTRYDVAGQRKGEDFFYHRKHGESDVLAVAHLDTVQPSHLREAHFLDTAGGEVVYSGALDDRLGAYVILELLPKLGIQHDILLTIGEESGASTAQHFDPGSIDWNWLIEFDRGGTDVVMYEYETQDLCNRVRASGARVGEGIFTDVCYLQHLGIKGINWGVGYQDYHSACSHAFIDDLLVMVAYYLRFHEVNKDVHMPHVQDTRPWWQGRYMSGMSGSRWWDTDDAWMEDRGEEPGILADDEYAQLSEEECAKIEAEIEAEEAERLGQFDRGDVVTDPTPREVTEYLERNML